MANNSGDIREQRTKAMDERLAALTARLSRSSPASPEALDRLGDRFGVTWPADHRDETSTDRIVTRTSQPAVARRTLAFVQPSPRGRNRTPRRLSLGATFLAVFTALGCSSAAATIPPDWTTVSTTVAPLPMAVAIPPDWKGYTYKLGFILYAEGPTSDDGALSVQEDPHAPADLATYTGLLATFCAQHGKTCVAPQIVHLPGGDAVFDPSDILGKGSRALYVFPAKNQAGVTSLLFVSTTATAAPAVWTEIARSFNPYAATLP